MVVSLTLLVIKPVELVLVLVEMIVEIPPLEDTLETVLEMTEDHLLRVLVTLSAEVMVTLMPSITITQSRLVVRDRVTLVPLN